jgi:phage tail P2-like protein
MTIPVLVQNILPSNATKLERAAVEALFERLEELDLVLETLWNPMTCPPELLPHLAWSLSADEWDATWPENTQRSYLAAWPQIVRKKGLLVAVERALAAAGYGNAEVIERFGWEFADGTQIADGSVTGAPPDHWAEYRVVITRLMSISQAAQVRRILRNVAPEHCRLKALDFRQAIGLANGDLIANGNYSAGIA